MGFVEVKRSNEWTDDGGWLVPSHRNFRCAAPWGDGHEVSERKRTRPSEPYRGKEATARLTWCFLRPSCALHNINGRMESILGAHEEREPYR
jgi:hypothetical protein